MSKASKLAGMAAMTSVGVALAFASAVQPADATQQTYPPCVTEESGPEFPPCYWDAQQRGNKQGRSFTLYPGGTVVYWEVI